MLGDFLRYDFGYDRPWTMGHAIAAVLFGLAAWAAWRAGWRRWRLVFMVLAVWAAAAGDELNAPGK